MKVILTEEDERSLRSFIYEIAVEEFKAAREDVHISEQPYNQTEIAKMLRTSTKTIREWETLGMPHGTIGSSKFYDFIQCKEWVLKQKE
ncbi:MerR family transcriptional regulator [Enterococcus ureasiticus]|uniref:MerR family transcriptional regulator n=1 Tax=Enterococcus ureasiticus TaxID=903984 RepID=UPI001A8DBA5E|nr:MerR family transcriptional regulator [Enterococcus ureasiticus]MBO0475079.1 MerR family transcriptional regulator [Enterococcus ureasiticus]